MSNACCEAIENICAWTRPREGYFLTRCRQVSIVRHNLWGVLKEGSERMALDRLDALETRIRDLVKLVQELKKKNAAVEEELKVVRQRLAEKDDSNRRWEQERVDIKSRIEKVLGDIELLECFEERKEVALD